MSILAVATWTAIGVLVFGSIAVFIWFLKDARSVLRPSEPTCADTGGSAVSEHRPPIREPEP